jgi:hypothetical protein
VVNADPKKSKYSDTLHRFCKKEHDWGWKKFMELSKVSGWLGKREISAREQLGRGNEGKWGWGLPACLKSWL